MATDAASFDISSNGVLTFKKPSPTMKWRETWSEIHRPQPTAEDKVYKVTVQATDADRIMGHEARYEIMVTNVDEPGVVTLSARQPMAGVLLTATLTDPDGPTTNLEWQWQKGSSNISGAEYGDLHPGGLGQRLLSTGDWLHTRTRRAATIPRGQMPGRTMLCCGPHPITMLLSSLLTRTLSMDGDQADAAREIAENTEAGENIGAPVAATDADSDQKLTYTLMTASTDD